MRPRSSFVHGWSELFALLELQASATLAYRAQSAADRVTLEKFVVSELIFKGRT
jgi:hypothetical protein